METRDVKTCIKCGEEKPYSEFYKQKGGKDGHRNDCKKCVIEHNKKYVEENREKTLAYQRQYHKKYNKEYYAKNREREKARAKKQFEENPDMHRHNEIDIALRDKPKKWKIKK